MNIVYYSCHGYFSNRIFDGGDGVDEYCKHLVEKQALPDPQLELLAKNRIKGYVEDHIADEVEAIKYYLATIDKTDSELIGSLMLMNPTRVLYAFKKDNHFYLFSHLEEDVKFYNGKKYPVEQVDLNSLYGGVPE